MDEESGRLIFEVHSILREMGAYERAINWLKKKKRCNIVVVGASGTGKTSLVKALQNLDAYVPRVTGRSASVETVTGEIDDTMFTFDVTPGEDLHKAKRIGAVKEASGKKNIGILNVVSYGYHEPDVPAENAVEDKRIIENFQRARLQKEIEILPEWTNILCGPGGSCSWVITVVTKADIWWEPGEHQSTLEYYRKGSYYEALGEAKSSAQTTHDVVPYSSLNQMFFGRVPMSGFYPDSLRRQHHKELAALLIARASGA